MEKNKTLLVTGASSDVGIMLIDTIIDNYAMVIAHYLHMNNRLRELKNKYKQKIWLLEADFSDVESTERMIAMLKEKNTTIDHIVHLAAKKLQMIPFRKATWEQFSTNVDISIRSIYKILQYLLHGMVKQRYGKVIFMLSSNVVNIPARNQSSYVITKYALLGLMKSLEVEYQDKGIIFNAVSPDMIDTKFLEDIPELIVAQSRQKNYRGKNLQVIDIIPTFEYLLSDAGDLIKGQNIAILNS